MGLAEQTADGADGAQRCVGLGGLGWLGWGWRIMRWAGLAALGGRRESKQAGGRRLFRSSSSSGGSSSGRRRIWSISPAAACSRVRQLDVSCSANGRIKAVLMLTALSRTGREVGCGVSASGVTLPLGRMGRGGVEEKTRRTNATLLRSTVQCNPVTAGPVCTYILYIYIHTYICTLCSLHKLLLLLLLSRRRRRSPQPHFATTNTRASRKARKCSPGESQRPSSPLTRPSHWRSGKPLPACNQCRVRQLTVFCPGLRCH
jgi:hypothetical protein